VGVIGSLNRFSVASILVIASATLFASPVFASNLPAAGELTQVANPAGRELGPAFGNGHPPTPGAPTSTAPASPTGVLPSAAVAPAGAPAAPIAPTVGNSTVSVILAPDARGPLPPALTMPASQVPPGAIAPPPALRGPLGAPAGAAPPVASAAAAPNAARLLGIAQAQLGARYTWGGTSPATGFDCSGFVYYVFSTYGHSVDRLLPGQRAAGRPVRREELRPGDVVFFENTYTAGLSHNGIYVGDGKFIHAADESTGVVLTPLASAYWDQRYAGAVRIIA
jgi:cell wall-associated NlpC family hydrolase